MNRTCPVCASKSVPFGQFLLSYTWFIPIFVALVVGVMIWVGYVILWRIPLKEVR